MGIIANPDVWKDGEDVTPPQSWEALEADSRWWFTDQNGDAYAPSQDQTISYLGDFPIGPELIFDYEVVEPASISIRLSYDFGSEVFSEEIPNVVGTGTITITVPEDASFFSWGITTDTPPGSFYTGTIAVAEGVVAEEEIPEGQYYKVEYLPVDEFVKMCNSRVTTSDDVVVTNYGPDDVQITIVTDRPPTYWTSINDEYILFDSYDSAVESSILADKTQIFVDKSPSFTLEDAHVINLPSNLMPYLERQVESYCMAVIKQQPNPKSEQLERRLRVRQQRNKWRHQRLNKNGPNFGR